MPDSTRCPSEGLANLLCSSPLAASGKAGRGEAVGAKYSGAPLRYLRFISGRDLSRGDGRERSGGRQGRREERREGEKKGGRWEVRGWAVRRKGEGERQRKGGKEVRKWMNSFFFHFCLSVCVLVCMCLYVFELAFVYYKVTVIKGIYRYIYLFFYIIIVLF